MCIKWVATFFRSFIVWGLIKKLPCVTSKHYMVFNLESDKFISKGILSCIHILIFRRKKYSLSLTCDKNMRLFLCVTSSFHSHAVKIKFCLHIFKHLMIGWNWQIGFLCDLGEMKNWLQLWFEVYFRRNFGIESEFVLWNLLYFISKNDSCIWIFRLNKILKNSFTHIYNLLKCIFTHSFTECIINISILFTPSVYTRNRKHKQISEYCNLMTIIVMSRRTNLNNILGNK